VEWWAFSRQSAGLTVEGSMADGVTCLHVVGSTVVSGGRDRLLRIWDLRERRCTAQLEGHTSNVRCVGSARGLLVSGGEAVLRIWDGSRGWRQSGSLDGHVHFVSALSMDDDLRLVSASWDRTLRIWHVPEDGASAQSVATLGGHTSSVLALDRRGDRAVSGSLSGEVYMWNLMTEQLTLRAHTSDGIAVNALWWERQVTLPSTTARSPAQAPAAPGGRGGWGRGEYRSVMTRGLVAGGSRRVAGDGLSSCPCVRVLCRGYGVGFRVLGAH